MVNVPDSLLAERRRTGVDLFDEMWEGLLHVVPAPSAAHQRLNAELMMVLGPLAKARGLVPLVEANVIAPTTTTASRISSTPGPTS